MRSWVFAAVVILATFAPLVGNTQATAPPGYHYETGGMTPVPNDPCWHPSLVSPGAIENVNRTLGKPQGVPTRVMSINDLAEVVPNALAMLGFQLVGYDPEQGGLACHVTLRFVNNSTQSGVLSMRDPGEYAAIEMQWIPDTRIFTAFASYDRHLGGKPAVAPDLKNPAIQMCVARAVVLGADEEFSGQLAAACTQKNGSDLLPPPSRDKHW